MDLVPFLQERLAEIENPGHDDVAGGRRAALWRAQQRAARLDCTLPELRAHCLETLARQRHLDEEVAGYLRGYRKGFQEVLREIQRLESGG